MLGQLQDEILKHFEHMLTSMGISDIPTNRFILSPTLDENDHLKLLEKRLARGSKDAQVKLPFAVAGRGQFDPSPTQRQFYVQSSFAKDITVGDPESGAVGIVRAAPIKLLYTYFIYSSTPDFLDTFIERWLLATERGYTAFEYAPTELGGTEKLQVNLVFGDVETVLSGITENRDRGTLFTLQLPIVIETVLTTAIGETGKVILDVDTNLDVEVVGRTDTIPPTIVSPN